MTESSATSRAITINLLTEAEAAQKQCRRAAVVVPGIGNQPTFVFPNCIASGCGHWRWHSIPDKSAIAIADTAGITPPAPTGCCGLAGHP